MQDAYYERYTTKKINALRYICPNPCPPFTFGFGPGLGFPRFSPTPPPFIGILFRPSKYVYSSASLFFTIPRKDREDSHSILPN
jgi:hypothetical protein